MNDTAAVITVSYSSIDGFNRSKRVATVAGARKFAQHWLGTAVEIGRGYAVSFDGVGRVTVQGASLDDLFPQTSLVEPSMSVLEADDWEGPAIHGVEMLLEYHETDDEARDEMERESWMDVGIYDRCQS